MSSFFIFRIFCDTLLLIGSLALLEAGITAFLSVTSSLANRLRVPPSVVSMLGTGSGWGKVVFVGACLYRNKSSLAINTIIHGHTASKAAAVAFGILYSQDPIYFERETTIAAVAMGITSPVLICLFYLPPSVAKGGAAVMFALYGVYVYVVSKILSGGSVLPQEVERVAEGNARTGKSSLSADASTSRRNDIQLEKFEQTIKRSESFFNLGETALSTQSHVFRFISAILLFSLASCAHTLSISNLASTISVFFTTSSGVLVGASQLPENILFICAARRGKYGVFLGNLIGSNFLLTTLCAGLFYWFGDVKVVQHRDVGLMVFETTSMVISNYLLPLVRFAGVRWLGYGVLLLYVVFAVVETSWIDRLERV